METPKMMAVCVKRSNFDVAAAIVPDAIFRFCTGAELYGRCFVVIHEPVYSNGGITLANCLVTEEHFDNVYSYASKIDPFSGEWFSVKRRANAGRPRAPYGGRFRLSPTYGL